MQSHTDPTLCTQLRQPCQPLCLSVSVVWTMPLSSLLDSAVDSTQVLQHLWIFLSFHNRCLVCPSHHFPSQENLNVLDSVSVAICQGSPSSPCIGDLFSNKSNTDFGFSVCSLVLMISHHLFHLFLFPFLCQCQWNSFPFLWENFVLSTVSLGATYPLASA